MKKLVIVGLAAALLAGCGGARGSMPQATGTGVELKGNNYRIIKTGARGESSGFYLLGILPLSNATYADAKSNLYQSVGQNLEGRSIALANQTYDYSSIYLVLFSVPKITITADIVEFTETATTP